MTLSCWAWILQNLSLAGFPGGGAPFQLVSLACVWSPLGLSLHTFDKMTNLQFQEHKSRAHFKQID